MPAPKGNRNAAGNRGAAMRATNNGGRPRTRRTISREAVVAVALEASRRLGRPATPQEEDDILSALAVEAARRGKGEAR